MIYLPKSQDEIIDIDVVASTETVSNFLSENMTYQVISSITYNGIDITKRIACYNVTDRNENELKKAIQNLFAAPEELIQINSNIVLNKIAFINQ
ncbi:hypothetical protein SDC9_69198 [bioreactor metagenome]|uniref:Uncharacterized protein n=1 Tax=bioreactor metagenome TaxID=1076179 RepID=A0A644Y2H2_9ZZZZ